MPDLAGVRSDERPGLDALLSGGRAFFLAVGLSDGILLAVHDREATGFRRDWRHWHARQSQKNRPRDNPHCASPFFAAIGPALSPLCRWSGRCDAGRAGRLGATATLRRYFRLVPNW